MNVLILYKKWFNIDQFWLKKINFKKLKIDLKKSINLKVKILD